MARSYQRMTLREKQAVTLENMREPAVRCPRCDTQTSARDLLAHVTRRCPGPPAPHPHSHWVNWRDALAVGLPRTTLTRWVNRGEIRVRGERRERQFLLRDLALRMAWRRIDRRR